MTRTSSTTSELKNTQCYQYAIDVVSGKNKMGLRVTQGCQRFLDDLQASKRKDYPWRFDVELAYRPIRYIEKFHRPTKGDYQRMTLLPWQHFVEGNLYGWVSKENGLRRFRDGIILVGSGNGKSTLVGGNATYGCSKDGERGAEVYCLANSKEQARIIFDECKSQIEVSPALSKHLRVTQHAIYYDKAKSKIRPLATDSRTLDGLNVHLAIFDEIQEYRNYKLINVINKKRIKRRQPLSIYISTFGDVIDGPLFDYYENCCRILDKDPALDKRATDRIFAYIAEIDRNDDPEDFQNWYKANPSLGSLLKLDDLKDEWAKAKNVPAEKAYFINKQLNVFTSTDELSFLDASVILQNNGTVDLDTLRGDRCYGGFDLSETGDFTSACLLFPLPDNWYFVLSHSWVPRKKRDEDKEKLDWDGLVKEGVLTLVDGPYVDFSLIKQWFVDMSSLYEIDSIGYDRAKAFELVNAMRQEGFILNEVIQGALTLTAPLDSLKERFLDRKIMHNNNRLMVWYLNNVKLSKRSATAVYLPTKQSSNRKIDGFAAMLNAYTEYHRRNPVVISNDTDLFTKIELR